jgi:hypothetical protein
LTMYCRDYGDRYFVDVLLKLIFHRCIEVQNKEGWLLVSVRMPLRRNPGVFAISVVDDNLLHFTVDEMRFDACLAA